MVRKKMEDSSSSNNETDRWFPSGSSVHSLSRWVQFSHSNFLQPHGLQHTRSPCPLPTPIAAQTHVHWVADAIQPSHPVVPFSSRLQSLPASGSFPRSQFFESGSQKYWSFSFIISPSNEYSGLISFRSDWFDLLAVQRILKNLGQHRTWKTSIIWQLAFFMV